MPAGGTGDPRARAGHGLGIHREALAALQVFRQAVFGDRLTADFTRRLLEYLHRARHDPKLRFKP
ncbi:MAG: hypothetical protein M3O15_00115 [Acidobacteriota bacterium]|nr:hypothetical protein [Acidobacteriota bacterium]